MIKKEKCNKNKKYLQYSFSPHDYSNDYYLPLELLLSTYMWYMYLYYLFNLLRRKIIDYTELSKF